LRFAVKLRDTVSEDINDLPEKSRRIIRIALQGLEVDPFPGTRGDKEKITMRGGSIIYRIHISRTYTAFYSVNDENRIVKVHDIFTIEQAHKKYGYFSG
jgi:mRNA-degrading endonuclease RelE of RelBE toxin-antitoxin system